MARYSDTLTNDKEPGVTGPPIVGALVSVMNQDGTLPVLTDDNGGVLSNPLPPTDEYGGYYFNAASAFYDLKYYYGDRLILERLGVNIGAATLPTGSIADAMGTATNVAPSQRAVSAAISGVNSDITTIQGNVSALQTSVSDAAMQRMFARALSGLSATSTADQTTAFQSAIDQASAYAIANTVLVELVLPKHTNGGIRARWVIPRPGVIINGNGGKGKLIDGATYTDHLNYFRQDYNNNSWTDVPVSMRDFPVHFGLINFTIDGNAAGASPWTWTIKRYDMTAGGTYTVFPTGLAFTGTAATGATATICGGLNDDWTIGAGGTGYVSGDVGRYVKLGVGTGGVLFNGTAPVLRIDAVSGGAITAGTLIGRGAFTTKPTGTLAQTAVVDDDNIARGAGTGFTLTPVTWRVVHVEPVTRPTGLYFTDTIEGGGALAVTLTGGTSTVTATLTAVCEGDYYKNGDQAQGDTDHNAGFWWRNPQGLAYAPRWLFDNVRVQNCQGDGLYWGSFAEVVSTRCSSHNCYRGGYTVVCGGDHKLFGFKMTGWGQGLDLEYSGGWMGSTSSVCVTGNYVTIVSGGTGYKVGDIVTVPVLTGATTYEAAQFLIIKVDASGIAQQMFGLSGGRYSSTAGSLTALATRGGTGSGLTLTLQAGKDTLTLLVDGMDADTTLGSHFIIWSGEHRIANSSFKGDAFFFLAAGGPGTIDWINNSVVSRVDGINFSTVMPRSFSSQGSRWIHRPRTHAVIPSNHNVQADRQSVINMFNDSGGACMPNAQAVFDGDTFDGRANYPLATYYGLNIGPAAYSGIGYNREVTLNNCSFEGDFYTNRISNDRAGLVQLNGGRLGSARGGGVRSSGDHTSVGGIVAYGSALNVTRLPIRGNANPFFDLPQPAGTIQDEKYFNRVVGVMTEVDNLWGGVNSGSLVYAQFAGLIVESDNDPTAASYPGIIGMRWAKRRPTTQAELRGWGVFTSSTTAATFAAA